MQKKVSFLFPFAFSIGWRSKFYQNLIKWLSFTINHQGNASYNSMTLGTNCMVVLQLTVYKWHNHFGKSFGSIYKKMNISHLCVCVCVCVLVAQLCLTLCDPMDCSSSCSSVHGIPRQKYWRGLPLPSPGNLPGTGLEPRSPASKQILYWLSHSFFAI